MSKVYLFGCPVHIDDTVEEIDLSKALCQLFESMQPDLEQFGKSKVWHVGGSSVTQPKEPQDDWITIKLIVKAERSNPSAWDGLPYQQGELVSQEELDKTEKVLDSLTTPDGESIYADSLLPESDDPLIIDK